MSIQIKLNDILVRDVEELDIIELDSTSQIYQFALENNSAESFKRIRLFLTPTDHEKFSKLMFYSDQYADSGIYVRERYTVIGTINKVVNNIFLEDQNLDFDFDFFPGETMNISAPVPENIVIDSFDIDKRRYKLATDPNVDPTGLDYSVSIDRLNKFSSLNGRPILNPIRLMTRSGRLRPGQLIALELYFKMEGFAFRGETLPFKLNVGYDNA